MCRLTSVAEIGQDVCNAVVNVVIITQCADSLVFMTEIGHVCNAVANVVIITHCMQTHY